MAESSSATSVIQNNLEPRIFSWPNKSVAELSLHLQPVKIISSSTLRRSPTQESAVEFSHRGTSPQRANGGTQQRSNLSASSQNGPWRLWGQPRKSCQRSTRRTRRMAAPRASQRLWRLQSGTRWEAHRQLRWASSRVSVGTTDGPSFRSYCKCLPSHSVPVPCWVFWVQVLLGAGVLGS